MSYGYQRETRIAINNTAVLNAYLYTSDEENLVPQENIVSVFFTVLAPGDDVNFPSVDNQAGTVIADGQGQYAVSPSINTAQGQYKAYAIFTYEDPINLVSDQVSTVICNYEAFDPFENAVLSAADPWIDQCWGKIEDCFDSELGGPWLRDMTLNVFDKSKLNSLIPEVMMMINQQMPFTDYTESSFPYTAGDAGAIFAEGLLISTIRHLMRSYTEQPDIVSSPVAFMDRKRYQTAWQTIYNIENPFFQQMLTRWKLRSYDIEHGSLLLGYKAGRNMVGALRSRNSGMGGLGY